MVKRSKSDVGDKDEKTYEFKKISEVGDSNQIIQKNEDEKQNHVYENQKEEEKN